MPSLSVRRTAARAAAAAAAAASAGAGASLLLLLRDRAEAAVDDGRNDAPLEALRVERGRRDADAELVLRGEGAAEGQRERESGQAERADTGVCGLDRRRLTRAPLSLSLSLSLSLLLSLSLSLSLSLPAPLACSITFVLNHRSTRFAQL